MRNTSTPPVVTLIAKGFRTVRPSRPETAAHTAVAPLVPCAFRLLPFALCLLPCVMWVVGLVIRLATSGSPVSGGFLCILQKFPLPYYTRPFLPIRRRIKKKKKKKTVKTPGYPAGIPATSEPFAELGTVWLNLLEPHSHLVDKLLGIRVNLSPQRDCGASPV